jgi:sigma-B regulation protein RsbU (phosphoserine phosphatase)
MTKENQPDANGRKPLRILMVEDSEDDVLLTVRALKNGGYAPVYERVETAEAMRKALREKTWDVILCDYQMPKFNGLDAIVLLQETGIDLPLIIVSGAIGEETAADCMRSGAHDYVTKGNLSRLVPAIERELQAAASRSKSKLADEALQESEKNYRGLFQNASIGIFHSLPEGKFLRVNPALAQMMGYGSPEELIASITDISTQIYVNSKKRSDILITAMEKAGWVYAENRYRRKDGTILTANLTARKVQNPDGTVAYLEGFVEDITERKQAEDNLKEALEKYRSLADNADSMYLVDSACTYLFINEGHLKRFALSSEEVVGKRYSEFHSEEDSKRLAEDVNEVCQTGNTITKEHRSERDGRYFLRTLTPIIGQSTKGEISQIAVISKDITNIKLSEKNLQETLASLRRAVNTTIQIMVSVVEARDPYTAGHQLTSANLARAIATEMGLPL